MVEIGQWEEEGALTSTKAWGSHGKGKRGSSQGFKEPKKGTNGVHRSLTEKINKGGALGNEQNGEKGQL